MADGVEDAQAGVGAVAGDEDHLDAIRSLAVQRQELFRQRVGDAGGKRLILLLDLVARVGIFATRLEDAVALVQVEKRARGDRHHQAGVLRWPRFLRPCCQANLPFIPPTLSPIARLNGRAEFRLHEGSRKSQSPQDGDEAGAPRNAGGCAGRDG